MKLLNENVSLIDEARIFLIQNPFYLAFINRKINNDKPWHQIFVLSNKRMTTEGFIVEIFDFQIILYMWISLILENL